MAVGLGEYCMTADFRKDYAHFRITPEKKEVVPGLRADIETALEKTGFKLHTGPHCAEMAITVMVLERSGKKYNGFRLAIEVDGPPIVNFALANLVGRELPTLGYFAKNTRWALEEALDQ